MSDTQLSDLFADGTAPERDPAFAILVAAGIGRARLRMRLLALAVRATVVLVLALVLFLAIRLSEPLLAQLLVGIPRFMGVPVPLVLGVLVAAVVLRAQLYILPLRRFAPPPS